MAGDIVTDDGLGIIANRLKATGINSPSFIAWGTGTTNPVVGNTVLETPSAEARTDGTETQQTTDNSNDTYRVVGTITSAGTQAITEVGLFTASSGGEMLVRSTFAAINLTLNDSITFTLNVDFDNS